LELLKETKVAKNLKWVSNYFKGGVKTVLLKFHTKRHMGGKGFGEIGVGGI